MSHFPERRQEIESKLFGARKRLKEYLLLVDPKRIADVDRLLISSSLIDFATVYRAAAIDEGLVARYCPAVLPSYREVCRDPAKQFANIGSNESSRGMHSRFAPDYQPPPPLTPPSSAQPTSAEERRAALEVEELEAEDRSLFRAELWLDMRISKLFTDLVRHYGVAESNHAYRRGSALKATEEADIITLSAFRSPRSPTLMTQTSDVNNGEDDDKVFSPSRSYSKRNEPEKSLLQHSGWITTSNHRPSQSLAEKRKWADDQVKYSPGAVTPSGFKRKDAMCPNCGVECLNPAEMHRHVRNKHFKETLSEKDHRRPR